ncbi:MAG: hypothetical protein IJG97_07080 [Bacilli bacterium]|nr:hypothetical protein [Bacilli bacterium]
MDGFNKDGKVEIYRDIFEGKTDEEIIELCEEFLGEFKGRYFDNKLIEERGRYDRAVAIDNLCQAIRESREKNMDFTPSERESVLKEFGMSGEITPLSALASRTIREEATEIIRQGFLRGFSDEPMNKEELERRINLVLKCCSADTFNTLMQKTIPQFYYGDNSKDVEDIERLQKDLPQFFQAVDFLLNSGVDLNKIQMAKNMTLQDVYMEVSQKYAKFFNKENKQEEKASEEAIIVEDSTNINDENNEISRMVDDSNNNDNLQYHILQEMQEIQNEINQLSARQANLLAKLQEMQKTDNNQITK